MNTYCERCGDPLRKVLIKRNRTCKQICVKCKPPSGKCPVCRAKLRTKAAQQCPKCLASWHLTVADYCRAESLFDEGTKHYEQKNLSKAELKLKEALQILRDSENIMYNLALTYLEQEKYASAWAIVDSIKEMDCKELIDELNKTGFVRKDSPNQLSKIECPRCGHILKEPDWRCPECYFEFEEESELQPEVEDDIMICEKCGEDIPAGYKFVELGGRFFCDECFWILSNTLSKEGLEFLEKYPKPFPQQVNKKKRNKSKGIGKVFDTKHSYIDSLARSGREEDLVKLIEIVIKAVDSDDKETFGHTRSALQKYVDMNYFTRVIQKNFSNVQIAIIQDALKHAGW